MESLQNMSVEELQKMQEDPERMDHLALESQELQSLQLEKEMYLAMNRRLAEENLAFQPRLDTGRLLLQERYEALGEAAAQYKQQKAKLDSFAATVDPKLMLPTLQDQLRIIEEESDEMAEKFLEGLISLESFLEDFSSKRRLSHQRRVRVEKLQELLKMQETAPQPSMQQSESQTQPFIHPAPSRFHKYLEARIRVQDSYLPGLISYFSQRTRTGALESYLPVLVYRSLSLTDL
ncbi:hypothetical protein NDU88_000496 [Pleurodeles waltl]|uniref:VPS37 C-terminal domain-containing protein n=1 Tax=Pleurodeles waltl TaxID=8319 RepID=A0AAV7SX63_PLEWA|nr:hypothetical protein NDU88_000496 [Pleurodeles waltl]